MSINNKVRGQAGEDCAAKFLTRQGFNILERNWRCPIGEVDLIAGNDKLTLLVEVKTRGKKSYGGGVAALTTKKQTKLIELANYFWATQTHNSPTPLRIDAIIVGLAKNIYVVEDWLQDIGEINT